MLPGRIGKRNILGRGKKKQVLFGVWQWSLDPGLMRELRWGPSSESDLAIECNM